MLTIKEIFEFLNGADDEWLYKKATEVKAGVYGDKVFIRGIIENNNICARNCFYCGIRAENSELVRYNLSQEQILECAQLIKKQNINSIVLQSGESDCVSDKELAQTIFKIKELTGADITLSFGEKSFDIYKLWKEAGADRYLLKIETLQKDVYEYSHPGYKLKDRLKCLEDLQKLDYQVGSGFIWGLPLYTKEKMAQDLLNLQKIGVHMYSTTPLITSKNTPFENLACGDVETVYRSNAIYRLLEPKVNIPVASACASLDEKSKSKGLMRGANVLMLSFTPESVRKNYSIYRGKNIVATEEISALKQIEVEIKNAGLVPSYTQGRSLYKRKK